MKQYTVPFCISSPVWYLSDMVPLPRRS
jgi:hypothetical protein